MKGKNLWNTTFEDTKVSRHLRGLLYKLGVKSAFSWDIDVEWIADAEL